MLPSLRAAPSRLQGNRKRFDLKQWCFPMAWPNAPPQDNCHRLSLKCRYKALCLSQLHCSLTSSAWVLNTELWIITCVPAAGGSPAQNTTSSSSGKSHTSKQEATLAPWRRNKTGFWGLWHWSQDWCHKFFWTHACLNPAILKQSPLGEKSITKMWSKTFSYATNKNDKKCWTERTKGNLKVLPLISQALLSQEKLNLAIDFKWKL